MRIVMMGTGGFACPSFEALLNSPHEILGLVTQPPRSTRGRGAPPPNPMRAIAEQRGIPVLTPQSVNAPEAQTELAALKPDLFVVTDYGQILAPETLAIAPLGGINLHGSLLPKYRGAAPINWAIYHGDAETGVTVIHMTPKVDAGPTIARASTPIGPDEDAVVVEQRLAAIGAPLVVRAVERLAAGDVQPLDQNASQASRARRLKKSDGEIDWTRPAVAIRNQIRALEPWPRTSTHWRPAAGAPVRLILGAVAVELVDDAAPASPQSTAGMIERIDGVGIHVATGQGRLVLKQVQPEGKRMMSAVEFMNGNAVAIGDTFGPTNEAQPRS